MKAGYGYVSEVKKVKSQSITRVIVDLPIEAHKIATELFDEAKVLVTLAPENMPGQFGIREGSEPVEETQATPNYGQYARYLDQAGLFLNPKIWVAAGSDAQFQEWVRRKKCAACNADGEWVEKVGEFRCEYAHVRRAGEAGTAIKPVFSGIPLCHACHQRQHNSGESTLELDCDAEARKYVSAWARETIKQTLGYESYRDIPPAELVAWATQRGIETYLPAKYREAACQEPAA